jgi:hypothetical protein
VIIFSIIFALVISLNILSILGHTINIIMLTGILGGLIIIIENIVLHFNSFKKKNVVAPLFIS